MTSCPPVCACTGTLNPVIVIRYLLRVVLYRTSYSNYVVQPQTSAGGWQLVGGAVGPLMVLAKSLVQKGG